LNHFLVAYNFFGEKPIPTEEIVNEQLVGGNVKFTEGGSDSYGSNTYRLVGKNNIKLPQTDVFIDLAHF
jgi:hypothetical protein